MTNTKTKRFITMARPMPGHAARLYRVTGPVTPNEIGGITVKTRNDNNGTHYFKFTPLVVLDMMEALSVDWRHESLIQFLEDAGVEAPRTIAKALLEDFYVYPHMQVVESENVADPRPQDRTSAPVLHD